MTDPKSVPQSEDLKPTYGTDDDEQGCEGDHGIELH